MASTTITTTNRERKTDRSSAKIYAVFLILWCLAVIYGNLLIPINIIFMYLCLFISLQHLPLTKKTRASKTRSNKLTNSLMRFMKIGMCGMISLVQ